MTETPAQQPLDLRYLASRLDISKVDLILVEGFKHQPVSKVFLYQEEIGRPLEEMLDEFVITVASYQQVALNIRSLDINQSESIANFIVDMRLSTLFDAWQCPTLTWGDPTLPSALRRFTAEFGMGSGGTTVLLPPGKVCFIFGRYSRNH